MVKSQTYDDSGIKRYEQQWEAAKLPEAEREVWRKKLKAHAVGEEPELTGEQKQLVRVFLALSHTRNRGESVGPIQFSEIDAYCRLSKRQLDLFELEAIHAMDRAWMNEVVEYQQRQLEAVRK